MGTIINVVAIIIGTLIGVIFKKGLPEKIQKMVMLALGLGLIAISLGYFMKDFFEIVEGVIKTRYDLLIIISLVFGSLLGEWIDIDERLNQWAHRVETKYKLPPLAKGFIAASLIFCVGAMAIIGSIQDGIYGDSNILIIKSALDFVTAMVLASVLGIGVIFSAVSVLIYQGSITLLATAVQSFLTQDMLLSLSVVGNILLVAIGINFTEIRRIKVANMLPSLILPILYFLIVSWIRG